MWYIYKMQYAYVKGQCVYLPMELNSRHTTLEHAQQHAKFMEKYVDESEIKILQDIKEKE